MIVKRQDLHTFIKVSNNLPNDQINPFIESVTNDSLLPIFGEQFINALMAKASGQYQNWASGVIFATGAYAVLNFKVYRSLTSPNVGNNPETSPTFWVLDELATFYYLQVRPYVCYKVGSIFLVWHGHNITQFGVVVMDESTSIPSSPQDRGNMIKFCEKESSIRMTNMLNAGKAANYTFDGVVYTVPINDQCCSIKKTSSPKIFAIK